MNSLHDRSGTRKYLNISERFAFYNAAQKIDCAHHRAFCLTLFYTGCRISEALALERGNIDRGENALIFKTLKQRTNTRHRALPVPADHLKLLLSCCGDSDRVWSFGRTTGWGVVKRCMKSASLDGIKATPKGLRHGFAIACISEGVPLPVVQKWLGHARMETTGHYLDFVGDDERALAKRVWIPRKKS